jgi:hypothetical protein
MGFSVNEDEREAVNRGIDGLRFFQFAPDPFSADGKANPVYYFAPGNFGNPIPQPNSFATAIVPPFMEFNQVTSNDFADTAHAAEVAMAVVGIGDPTYPLYSPTDSGPGVTERQAMIDGITNIAAGRGREGARPARQSTR